MSLDIFFGDSSSLPGSGDTGDIKLLLLEKMSDCRRGKCLVDSLYLLMSSRC